mmetsp:Transcript_57745/g.141039  ORF Transcript_57745/g.141039 Transcript_57745/m.141039 type:complete len:504 (+) Transcript_57745:907-2418(+)
MSDISNSTVKRSRQGSSSPQIMRRFKCCGLCCSCSCCCWHLMSLIVVLAPTVGAILVVVTLNTLLRLVDGEGITIYDRSISQALTRVYSYRVVAVPLSVGAFLFFLSIIIRNIQIDIQLRSDRSNMNSGSRNDNEASRNDATNTCHNIDKGTQTETTDDQKVSSNSNRSSWTYNSSECSSSVSSSTNTNMSSVTTNCLNCLRVILRVVNYLSAVINVVSLLGFVMLVVFKATPGQDKEGREAYLHNLGSYIYFGGSVLYGWLHVLIMCGMKICCSYRTQIDSSCRIYGDIESIDEKNNDNLKKSSANLDSHQGENEGIDDPQLCDVELGRDEKNNGDDVKNLTSKTLTEQQQGQLERHACRSSHNYKYICYTICHTVCLLLMSASGIATTYSTVKYMQLFKDGYQWEWFAVIFASVYMCLYSVLFILDNPMHELRIAAHQVWKKWNSLRRRKRHDPHAAPATMTVSRTSSSCLSSSKSVERKQTADTVILDDNGDVINVGTLE